MEFMKAFWNGFKSMAAYCAVVYSIIAVVISVVTGIINAIVECTTWFDRWL